MNVFQFCNRYQPQDTDNRIAELCSDLEGAKDETREAENAMAALGCVL